MNNQGYRNLDMSNSKLGTSGSKMGLLNRDGSENRLVEDK
jgi:hypothetical protein